MLGMAVAEASGTPMCFDAAVGGQSHSSWSLAASSPPSLPSRNILKTWAGSIGKDGRQFPPPELEEGSSGFNAARVMNT